MTDEIKTCLLDGCEETFVPSTEWQKFCKPEHKDEYWAGMRRLGRDISKGNAIVLTREEFEKLING